MNFDWSNGEREAGGRVASLFKDKSAQAVEALERAEVGELRTSLLKYYGELAESGYLGLGLGLKARAEIMDLTAAQKELAEISGSLFLSVESSARLCGGFLAGWGASDACREILDDLTSGRVIGAAALSEPGGEKPRPARQTVGRAQGDGYLVSGRKSFVTNGPLADWIAVSGLAEDRPAVFLVRPDQAGVKIGPRLETLGYRGLAVSTLELSGAAVPAELTLGPFDDDEPFVWISRVQDLILAISALAVTRGAMDEANRHARTHHRANKPVYAYQEVRFKLSDMFTLYQTAELLVCRAAWFFSQGDREAPVLINCAKVFAADAAEKAAGLSMQILAGQGFIAGNPVERGYREAKYAGLAGTTSEVARMAIADEMLRRHPV